MLSPLKFCVFSAINNQVRSPNILFDIFAFRTSIVAVSGAGEESSNYTAQLETALGVRNKFIENKRLPHLKENFKLFQTLFENIYNILLRKSLIQEDPYKYEQKLSEITPPPKDTFIESEKQQKMSQRLSEFHRQLDFLNNYYQFSLEFLNLNRIKLIVGLVKYINWQNVSTTSSYITTMVLAEYVQRVKQGTDKVSVEIIKDAVSQLDITTKQIMAALSEITFWLRENYKLELRRKIFSLLPDMKAGKPPKDSIFNTIKRMFVQSMQGSPFFPSLVEEVLAEDYSSQSKELRQIILEKLAIKEVKPKKKKKEPAYKAILLEAVRNLTTSGITLKNGLAKLNDNSLMLNSRKVALGEKFSRWIRRTIQKRADGQIFEVEYFDSTTSATRIEKIAFTRFYQETQKKAKLFISLANKMSTAYQRLEGAGEEQIFDFLGKNLGDLQLIYRRMEGLSTYFRSEFTQAERYKLKDTKLELAALKNSVVKTNKIKHDYVSRKEEEQQMKKLGIRMKDD